MILQKKSSINTLSIGVVIALPSELSLPWESQPRLLTVRVLEGPDGVSRITSFEEIKKSFCPGLSSVQTFFLELTPNHSGALRI